MPLADINISKVRVGSGVAGALVALSIVVLALIGLPHARMFLLGSVGLGVAVAIVLRLARRG